MSVFDMSIDDLLVLVQVAERGGFTAAAKVLGRSTKQVSRQVARLEATIGERLLHRTTHAVSTTTTGRRVLDHARAILAVSDAMGAELQDAEASATQRELRVAVPTLDFGVASWLARLQQQFPRVCFDVTVSDAPLDLARLGLDLQLVVVRPSQTSFVVRRLCTLRAVLAAHRSYLDRHGAPEVPADLEAHRCLLWNASGPQPAWTLRRGRRSVEIPVTAGVNSQSSGVLLSALREGAGIGVCGRAWLDARKPSERLVRVLPEWEPPSGALFAVFPGPGRRPPVVEAFLALAVESVGSWY